LAATNPKLLLILDHDPRFLPLGKATISSISEQVMNGFL